MTKLNLGCGNAYLKGYVNIDREAKAHTDLILDIEGEPWPFEDGSVTEINASHILEHVHDLLWVMSECYRVMAPGAELHIAVPHHHSDGFYGDPTHVRPITLAQLELFSRKKCAAARAKGYPNTPLAEYLNVDFEVIRVETDLMPHWANQNLDQTNIDFAILTYNNVVDTVRFTVKRV